MRTLTLIFALSLALVGCADGPAIVDLSTDTDDIVDTDDTGDVDFDQACTVDADEVGAADYGRDDIAMCETSSYKTGAEAAEVCNADAGWHVCSESEYMERNGTFKSWENWTYVGTLDGGNDCAIAHGLVAESDGRSDNVRDDGFDGGGTCDPSLQSDGDFEGDEYGYYGRGAGSYYVEADLIDVVGVMCCN